MKRINTAAIPHLQENLILASIREDIRRALLNYLQLLLSQIDHPADFAETHDSIVRSLADIQDAVHSAFQDLVEDFDPEEVKQE